MTERRTAREREAGDSRGRGEDRTSRPGEERQRDGEPRRGSGSGEQMTAAMAAQAGLRHLAELTGRQPEGVTAVEPGEGGWLVGVEVVEDRRVPSSSDVLATYEVEVDADGTLLAYRRLRRYPRGRGGDEGTPS